MGSTGSFRSCASLRLPVIRIVYHRNPFDPQDREEWESVWVGGTTPEDLAPIGLDPGSLNCTRNGVEVDGDGWGKAVVDGDLLSYSIKVTGIEATTFTFLGQSVFTASGVVASAAFLGSYLINALLFSYAVKALTGGDEKPPVPGEQDSRYYGFGGITANTDYSGAALPVVYGDISVAGLVINRFVQAVSQPTDSFLYTLIALAGHQVQEIGGISADGGPFTSAAGDLPVGLQIDNQPAENLADVECYVRMGTPEQATIPGFELAQQQFGVESTLLESTDAANVEAASGVYTASDPEITKWDTEVSYTMGSPADQATPIVNFPQGLFNVGSSGSVSNQTVRIQARYVQVDGGGTPTSDFIVLPPFPDIVSSLRVQFDVQFPFQFIDVLDFGPPAAGNYLIAASAGDYCQGPATTTGIVEQSPDATAATVYAWVRLRYSLDAASTRLDVQGGTVHPIFGQFDNANTLGFEFNIVEQSDTTVIVNGSAIPSPSLALQFKGGDGTVVHQAQQGGTGFAQAMAPATITPGGTSPGDWVFCAFSYEANKNSDGSGEIFFWADQAQLGATITVQSTQRPVWDSTQQIRVGRNQSDSTSIEGNIDECVVYQRAFSVTEFLSRGTGPATTAEVGIVAGWHFDVDFTDFVGSNDLTTVGSPTISTTGTGPVSGSSSGTPRSGLYRIDLQRINAEATGQFAQDQAVWSNVILTEFEPFSYPGCALLAVKVKATDQLSGSAPLIRVPVKGKLCNIWDGVDPVNPVTVRAWSGNPAWVLSDMGTDTELTGTAVYPAPKIDWLKIKGFADYCDELVYDGKGRRDIVAVSIGAATSIFPNGFMQIDVDGDTYPLGWEKSGAVATSGDLGSDLNGLQWFTVSDTDLDGSAPAWLTAKEDIALPIGSIGFNSINNVYLIRVGLAVAEATTSIYNPPTDTIQAARFERRMRFDGVFDRDDFPFEDATLRVAQSARGIPLFPGDRLSVFWDAPRAPSHAVTMGNIVRGSWRQSASGAESRFNHEIVQFLDRDSNFDPDQEQDYAPDVINPAIADAVRTRRLSLEGVTRRSQVARQIKYDLNVFRLLKRYAEFSVGPDGIGYQIGDGILASHDVPQWGDSGRLIQDSPDAQTLYLDRDVVVASLTEYEVTIRESATGTIETVAVTGLTAGTYLSGETITLDAPLSFTPTKHSIYAWGETALSTREFQAMDVTFDLASKSRKVRCLQYDSAVYDDEIDDLEDAESVSAPEAGRGSLGAGVENLDLDDDTVIGSDGRVTASLRVSWTYAPTSKDSVASVLVWLADSDGNGLELVGQAAHPATSFVLPSERVELATEYQVRLQEVTREGTRRSLSAAQSVHGSAGGFGPALAAPTGLSATISGELLYIQWDSASVSMAKTVEVRMGGWILGTPVGSAPADQGYLVVDQWASGPTNDIGRAAPDLVFRSIDSMGRPSKAGRLSFDADVVDTSGQIAYESNQEDSGTTWSGTKTSLSVTPVPVGDPPLERTAYLGFTGAGLSASYAFSPNTLPEPEEVYAQIFVEAYQIHPRTWEEMGAWNSMENQRWTWEGPLWTLPGETPNATLSLSLAHGVGSSVSAASRKFIPGKYALRSSDVTFGIERPSMDYNARVDRMAVRYTRVHEQPDDHLAIGVFR